MNIKSILLALTIQLLAKFLFGCGCGGPINDMKVDIDSSDAIFTGEITSINSNHNFHLNNETGFGLKYLNFNILKTIKGLNPGQLKISVFDYMSFSSCQGLINGKQVGDTVLIFASEFKEEMLGSYLCGRHPKITELNDEEFKFLDTVKWTNPKIILNDSNRFNKKHFIQENSLSNTENPKGNILQRFLLYASLILNIVFLTIWIKRKTRDNTV